VVVQGKYGPYNKLAGIQRNTAMRDKALKKAKKMEAIPVLLAFEGDTGTQNMITKCLKTKDMNVFYVTRADDSYSLEKLK
jgi:hypothetical protein